jgi:hypothetical protein
MVKPRPKRNIRVVGIRRDPPDFKLLSKALIGIAEHLAQQDAEKERDKLKAKNRKKPGRK